MGCAVFMQQEWRSRSSAGTKGFFAFFVAAQLAGTLIAPIDSCIILASSTRASNATLKSKDFLALFY